MKTLFNKMLLEKFNAECRIYVFEKNRAHQRSSGDWGWTISI